MTHPSRTFPFKPAILHRFSLDDARELLRFAQVRLREERLPQVAGSLTFTTVLALVPILTVALALFTIFPLFNTFRASLEAYFIQSLMPKTIANTILGYLNQFASKATRLSAFGAIGLIVTAIVMMLTIDRAFNQIWRVKAVRPLSQRLLIYWAIVTLGPLAIGASISLTADLIIATAGMAKKPGALYNTLLSVALTTGAFTLLYTTVPNRHVDWRDAAWGGLLAACAFESAKRIFVVFVTKFPTYTMVYGALAAMPIFLLWIYVSWLIVLMGAVLAAALPVVKYERWRHVATPGSAFLDAMAILGVLYHARAHSATATVDAPSIRVLTRIGFDESESLLEKMHDARWVGRLKAPSSKRNRFGMRYTPPHDAWTLLANPEQITVADVYRLFVFNATGQSVLAREVEMAVEQGLGQTLAGHFGENRAPAMVS